jgi:hypothetical protein
VSIVNVYYGVAVSTSQPIITLLGFVLGKWLLSKRLTWVGEMIVKIKNKEMSVSHPLIPNTAPAPLR